MKNNNIDKSSKNLVMFLSRELILKNIRQQLVNSKCVGLDESIPHKNILDLSLIYRVFIPNDAGYRCAKVITYGDLQTYKITLNELERAAQENMENLGFVINPIEHMIAKLAEAPIVKAPHTNLYVMTNSEFMYGASIILYPKNFLALAEKFHDNLYVIPSSIHEVLATPKSYAPDAETLQKMIKDINSTVVRPEEVLSNNVYEFDRTTCQLRIVTI